MLEAIDRSHAVIEFDINGSILNANENFLKAFGYIKEEILGENQSIFCQTPHNPSLENRSFWEKIKKGEFQSGEYLRFGKDAREVWIVASYNPIKGLDGKPYKVICFATDITATKAELKVRTDIMNMTSIVSEADLKGNIIAHNQKYCDVSGYNSEELMGQPHNITRHPDMPKEVFKAMWATIGRGQMFRGVVKNKSKSGVPYYVDAVIAPIMGENGKPKKYLGFRYDITESETERQNMRGVIRAIDSTYAYAELDINGRLLSAN